MLLLSANHTEGQVTNISEKEWIKKLSDPEDKKSECFYLLWNSLIRKPDTIRLNEFLNQLEVNANSQNIYFRTRLGLLKVAALNYKDVLRSDRASKAVALHLMKQGMEEANESNDEYLIAFVSKFYFSITFIYNETELAVMYSIRSIELHEKLYGSSTYTEYHFAGELMYRVKEYEKCKDYSLKWLL